MREAHAKVPIVIVGLNKEETTSLQNNVRMQASSLANQFEYTYLEGSYETGIGVQHIFDTALEMGFVKKMGVNRNSIQQPLPTPEQQPPQQTFPIVQKNLQPPAPPPSAEERISHSAPNIKTRKKKKKDKKEAKKKKKEERAARKRIEKERKRQSLSATKKKRHRTVQFLCAAAQDSPVPAPRKTNSYRLSSPELRDLRVASVDPKDMDVMLDTLTKDVEQWSARQQEQEEARRELLFKAEELVKLRRLEARFSERVEAAKRTQRKIEKTKDRLKLLLTEPEDASLILRLNNNH